MATEIPLIITATAQPSTPGLGASLAGLGTAAKVLVLTHPVSIAAVGGFLLGIGAFYALTRRRSKDGSKEEVSAAAPAPC